MKKSDYIDKPAIAVYADSAFDGLEILDITDDFVVIRDWVHRYTPRGKTKTEEIHIYKLYWDTERVYFRYKNGIRYHIDDFMKV